MKRNSVSTATPSIEFDVWGARGSRSLVPPASTIGNNTSCYSVRRGEDLFVLDGGRGLGALASAMAAKERFESVKRVHLFVSHAHMDHWEGLKDTDWFWQPQNGLELSVFGRPEALRTIRKAYGHPSYVPMELLAESTLGQLRFVALPARSRRTVRGWTLQSYPLNHYSGGGKKKHRLDTIGLRLSLKNGPTICYLCDHEPTERTRPMELRILATADLVVMDAHFRDIDDHAFGHGSIEHAAETARQFPRLLVLAGHHAPMLSDDQLRDASQRHGEGLANFRLAVEGTSFWWDAKKMVFRERRPKRQP